MKDFTSFVFDKGGNPGVIGTVLQLKTQVLFQAASFGADYPELPIAASGKIGHYLGTVWTADSKSGTVFQMKIQAIESICPKSAIGTAFSHVVHQDKFLLIAENFGELDFFALAGFRA